MVIFGVLLSLDATLYIFDRLVKQNTDLNNSSMIILSQEEYLLDFGIIESTLQASSNNIFLEFLKMLFTPELK